MLVQARDARRMEENQYSPRIGGPRLHSGLGGHAGPDFSRAWRSDNFAKCPSAVRLAAFHWMVRSGIGALFVPDRAARLAPTVGGSHRLDSRFHVGRVAVRASFPMRGLLSHVRVAFKTGCQTPEADARNQCPARLDTELAAESRGDQFRYNQADVVASCCK